MKSQIAYVLCATVLAAVTSGPIAAETSGPPEGLTQSPMELHRNADGSIKRGLRNTIQTGYWSGFAATAAAPYTSASGTFQVPNVIYSGTASISYAAPWVGIGGYGDYTLIQLGVLEAVGAGGSLYQVWYELYPAPSVYISHTVKPGDIITASLQCTAACSPSQMQTWLLTMTNETAGWAWTQTVQYQSSMASAEWIVEAPFNSSGETPLADYTRTTFDPVSANGANPNLTLAANGIQMLNPWGETSNPSAPVGGDAFSTCWGLAPSFTPCTVDSVTTPPPAAPTASLSANPKSITTGQSSTLSWSATNASSCTGSGFDTASQTAGSAIVKPNVTTAYAVQCTGEGGSATATTTVTATATVKPIDGHCGSSNGQHLTTAPTNNLCASGGASAVSSTGQMWSWSCAGLNGGHTQQCSASLLVNGQCGAANGVATNKAPSSGLCAAGTASGLGGHGPWNWNCNGSNGGKNASCSAPL